MVNVKTETQPCEQTKMGSYCGCPFPLTFTCKHLDREVSFCFMFEFHETKVEFFWEIQCRFKWRRRAKMLDYFFHIFIIYFQPRFDRNCKRKQRCRRKFRSKCVFVSRTILWLCSKYAYGLFWNQVCKGFKTIILYKSHFWKPS